MRWNPTLFYWERNMPNLYGLGISFYVGWHTSTMRAWNLMIHLGPRTLRIERCIIGEK